MKTPTLRAAAGRSVLLALLVILWLPACGGGGGEFAGSWSYTGQLSYRGQIVEANSGTATITQDKSDAIVNFNGTARLPFGQRRPFTETLTLVLRDTKITSLPFTATVQLGAGPVGASISAAGTASRERIELTVVYNLPQNEVAYYTFSLTRGKSPGA